MSVFRLLSVIVRAFFAGGYCIDGSIVQVSNVYCCDIRFNTFFEFVPCSLGLYMRRVSSGPSGKVQSLIFGFLFRKMGEYLLYLSLLGNWDNVRRTSYRRPVS